MKHKHKWRRVTKDESQYVCTWGLDGERGNQCIRPATKTCDGGCDDARCAVHAKKARRAK